MVRVKRTARVSIPRAKNLSLVEKERAAKMKVIQRKIKTLKKTLTEQKKKKAKAKKVVKKVTSCKESAGELSEEFNGLVPTSRQIQKLNKQRYKTLRAEVSATLNKIRKYTYRCESVIPRKRKNKKRKRSPVTSSTGRRKKRKRVASL